MHAAGDGLHREGRLLPQSGGKGQFGRVALAVNQQVGFLTSATPRPKPNSRSEEYKHEGCMQQQRPCNDGALALWLF